MYKHLCFIHGFSKRLSRLHPSYLSKATLHHTQILYQSFHKHETYHYSTTTTPNPTSAIDIKYIPIEDAENLQQYCPGGYHPTSIGDHIHNRYDIIHKLGFGSYSTSWLARDQKEKRYMAVKIGLAGASAIGEGDCGGDYGDGMDAEMGSSCAGRDVNSCASSPSVRLLQKNSTLRSRRAKITHEARV